MENVMKDAQSIRNDLENVKLPAWQLDATTPDEYHCCEMRRGREFLVRMMTGADPSLAIARFAKENNIRFGKTDATDEEIIAAAKKACCHDFIMRLPQGYDTMVGEGGCTLSGGEKQRISIARAMLKDAQIILLDEATASLDPENEVEVQKAIDSLIKGRTVIAIAHRLKTIKDADRIIVLEDGRIKEEGTHDELIRKEGLYAHLWNIQESISGWKL